MVTSTRVIHGNKLIIIQISKLINNFIEKSDIKIITVLDHTIHAEHFKPLIIINIPNGAKKLSQPPLRFSKPVQIGGIPMTHREPNRCAVINNRLKIVIIDNLGGSDRPISKVFLKKEKDRIKFSNDLFNLHFKI